MGPPVALPPGPPDPRGAVPDESEALAVPADAEGGPAATTTLAMALYDWVPDAEEEEDEDGGTQKLSLRAGEEVIILGEGGEGWMYGRRLDGGGEEGWLP